MLNQCKIYTKAYDNTIITLDPFGTQVLYSPYFLETNSFRHTRFPADRDNTWYVTLAINARLLPEGCTLSQNGLLEELCDYMDQ